MRIAAVDDLLFRYFDDEAIVFDGLSWDVHLLNPAALAVLELLRDAPRSEPEVVDYLEEVLQPDEQSNAPAHASRLIGELRSLGLIREVD